MIRVVRDAGGCPCPSDEGNEPTVTRVEIALDECWTLGAHSTYRGRSALGDLLSRAKYGPDRPSADRVAACMGWWAARLCEFSTSRLSQRTVVNAVPANPRPHPSNHTRSVQGRVGKKG